MLRVILKMFRSCLGTAFICVIKQQYVCVKKPNVRITNLQHTYLERLNRVNIQRKVICDVSSDDAKDTYQRMPHRHQPIRFIEGFFNCQQQRIFVLLLFSLQLAAVWTQGNEIQLDAVLKMVHLSGLVIRNVFPYSMHTV